MGVEKNKERRCTLATKQGKVARTSATTLFGLADEVGATLVITRAPKRGSRFICSLEHAETKMDEHSSILESTYGTGYSPGAAMADYAAKIRGKVLVFYAYTPECKAFRVSSALVY